MIMSHPGMWGVEQVPLLQATGRILAEDIFADRDLPPYHRVTMDGIAIRYSDYASGQRTFRIEAVMAAGDTPPTSLAAGGCIELMTGCMMPPAADTVIRYEDVDVADGFATVKAEQVKQGANVHVRGSDIAAGAKVIGTSTIMDAAVISMAASVGRHTLVVKRLPQVAIITTGTELVDIDETPAAAQVRRSNSYAIAAALHTLGISATLLHIKDSVDAMRTMFADSLSRYDVIVVSGGVSMGKYDHVPAVLNELGVQQLFHKVRQRPGKPFWYGIHRQHSAHVFAFPGNPVSAFMCTWRYLIPWLQHSLTGTAPRAAYAVLGRECSFAPALQYFLQVSLAYDDAGRLVATPLVGNGSGDFSNLLQADAFMELPEDKTDFTVGDVYRIWPWKKII